MRMPTVVIWGVCIAAHLSHAGDRSVPPDISRSVVRVVASYQEPNALQPWQKKPQDIRSGSGCVLSARRILTNAHVVQDSIYVQVLRAGEGVGYPAEVVYIAPDCDLAVLQVPHENFWGELEPLELGPMPELCDNVTAFGFPIGGDKLSVTNGVVSRIELCQYTNSNRKLLAIQIDAALNPGNSGGPVMKEGRLVGVAFQGIRADEGDNIGYMIPPPILKRFLADLDDRVYNGIPSLSIRWQKMKNTSMMAFHRMGARTGVLVTAVSYDGTLHGHVYPGDVLLSIDHHRIYNDGMVAFGRTDRVCFEQVVAQKQLNQTVTVEILRKGNVVTMQCPLRPFAPLVPSWAALDRTSYCIFGGLVFVPLTKDYVSELLSQDAYSPSLEELLHFADVGMPSPERRRIVILTQVLPDNANFGYHDIQHAVVAKVNGKTIADLRDLAETLDAPKPTYQVIELSNGRRIVLNAAKSREATKRIARQFGVPYSRSADLMVITAQKGR